MTVTKSSLGIEALRVEHKLNHLARLGQEYDNGEVP
jgi:hypothetical protein